ncbi:MAG: hypothetical protein R2729_15595 [Bryobacteraceae bacterium]
MFGSRIVWFVPLFLLALPGVADVSGCACDPARSDTMSARECGLCREAEKQPTGQEIFYLKDINPRKPNRWLALPRTHGAVGHPLYELPPRLQAALWKAAIAKGEELWGKDGWGLAYNGEKNRTQCHGHIHIGKLLNGLAPGKYYDVTRVEQIQVPADGTGLWIHPVGNKIRVHYGEGITETALLR